MKAKDLKVGDRIRITGVPKNRDFHSSTAADYERLALRKRSVRISEVSPGGIPMFECRFREPCGQWVYQYWIVLEGDDNWVPVKKRAA